MGRKNIINIEKRTKRLNVESGIEYIEIEKEKKRTRMGQRNIAKGEVTQFGRNFSL